MLSRAIAVERAGSGIVSESSCIVSVMGLIEGADSAHPETSKTQVNSKVLVALILCDSITKEVPQFQ